MYLFIYININFIYLVMDKKTTSIITTTRKVTNKDTTGK